MFSLFFFCLLLHVFVRLLMRLCRRRATKGGPHSSRYPSDEDFGDEDEVWLVWMDKDNENQENSIRQLAQGAGQGNAHDENVLTYYRYTSRDTITDTHPPKNALLSPIDAI